MENNGTRKYEGLWTMSMKEGQGVESFGNGDLYIGEYSHDKFHGKGELTTAGGKYTGHFKNGFKEGMGRMVFKNGCRYEGKFKLGRFDGKGLYIWTGIKSSIIPELV